MQEDAAAPAAVQVHIFPFVAFEREVFDPQFFDMVTANGSRGPIGRRRLTVKRSVCSRPPRIIWQQIGNSTAPATAMRLQCERVQHRGKWF
jgi:hypothetical protein